MRFCVIVPALALAAGWPAAAGVLAAQAPSLTLRDTAVLRSRRLVESSGIAASTKRHGIYWTINDSGDRPRLYVTDSAGTDLGFVTVRRARNRDWEDLASGPCGTRPERCLYIADIGDNRARRRSIVVYRVVEPEPTSGPADTIRTVALFDSLVLRYPDRSHDAEALAVAHGRIYIVTKDRRGPAGLFTASLGAARATPRLEASGALPISVSALTGRLATGADISPDGRWLAVRTYVSLHLFRLDGDRVPAAVTGPAGIPLPVIESQGEAIAFDGDARHLVLSSERGTRNHAILSRLTLEWPAR